MHRATRFALTFLLLPSALTMGCGAAETLDLTEDGQYEMGLSAGKGDGSSFSDCELREVLTLVNAPTSDGDALRDVGVHSRAADNIATARAGLDGLIGTEDDALFDSIRGLDDVFFVGPAAFRQLVAAVSDLCGAAEVEVIFSPQAKENSHIARAIELIDRAQRSIDIAMYSFSDSGVSSALEAAIDRGVTVRFVFESARSEKNSPEGSKSSRLEDLGVDVRYVNKIMHHKYAIFDGPTADDPGAAHTATLLTGSANWSNSAATRYDENTTLIRGHQESLLRFQREFDMMWNHSRDFVWNNALMFQPATLADVEIPHDATFDAVFTSDNFDRKVTSHGNTFSVVAGRNTVSDRLVAMIEGASDSILVASGHLRSRPVSEALMAKMEANPEMDIRVYLDSQEYISASYQNTQLKDLDTCLEAAGDSVSKTQGCMDRGFLFGQSLHLAGVPVRYKYYAYRWHYSYAPQMHNKFMIIDGRILASGSYNLSDNAEHNTLENVAIYDASGGGAFGPLIAAFEERFEALWNTERGSTKFNDLIDTIETATDSFPIVFDAMSLDWEEVTVLKGAIRDNCPMIGSTGYRTEPEKHFFCEL
ncbi:MAG: phosphatidylserine/phosphatidylglycerophosphate/cardiolipin synthase-like enzyme [Myxococcota bacterium]|jgi:phosphatidylserine/phosphatidylglycerophosphate/cardiolipin synthase-like enzyme